MANVSQNTSKRKYYLSFKYLVPKLKEDYLLNNMSFGELETKYKVPLDVLEYLLGGCKKEKRSKPEITLFEILNELYPNQEILEQVPIGFYYMDIYIPKMRLCFEYDGEFHFNQNDWVHGSDTIGQYKFEHTVDNDNKKNELCKKDNIYVIRLSNKIDLNVETIKEIIHENFEQIMDNLAKANAVDRFESSDI